jgi:predicted dehydrogenase
MGKLRAGIIGTGRGWLNARMLTAQGDAEVVAMCSLDESTLLRLASEHGFRAVSDWKELTTTDDIDCVFVSVPNYLHEEIAVLALRARKHVYVDYPMTTSTVSTDRMIAAAQKTGKILAP